MMGDRIMLAIILVSMAFSGVVWFSPAVPNPAGDDAESESIAQVERSEPTNCYFMIQTDTEHSVRLQSPHDWNVIHDGRGSINAYPGEWVVAELFTRDRTLWNRTVTPDCELQEAGAS